MITYNDIYEAARKERHSSQLQPIAKNFVLEVAKYLKEKKEFSHKEEDVFSDVIAKSKKQLENAITLFKELILRRKKKILNLVLIAAETGISKRDFENMLAFEKNLFDELITCIGNSEKQLNQILNGNGNEKKEKEKNNLILFLEDTEEFIGLNREKMGPYEKGQIANIPREIAKILIEDNKAEVIEK